VTETDLDTSITLLVVDFCKLHQQTHNPMIKQAAQWVCTKSADIRLMNSEYCAL
jgi:hypothetical protein